MSLAAFGKTVSCVAVLEVEGKAQKREDCKSERCWSFIAIEHYKSISLHACQCPQPNILMILPQVLFK